MIFTRFFPTSWMSPSTVPMMICFLVLRSVFGHVGTQYFEAGTKCVGAEEQFGDVVDVGGIELSRLFHGRHQSVPHRGADVDSVGEDGIAQGPDTIFIHGDDRVVQSLYQRPSCRRPVRSFIPPEILDGLCHRPYVLDGRPWRKLAAGAENEASLYLLALFNDVPWLPHRPGRESLSG